jgi:hypothetical protein
MHLLKLLTVQGDVEHGRRECRGNGGGGEQEAADRVQRTWVAARGNSADIPDHGLLGIEVCRPDEQESPLPVSLGKVCLHILIQVLGYGLEQRRVVSERIVPQGGSETTRQ